LFYPSNIKKSYDEIPVLISDLKIYNKEVALINNDPASPLINTILYTNKLELDHRQNNFTLGFSGQYYSNPGKIKYQYKLDPIDGEWNSLGSTRTVSFQNLRAGEYHFLVRASNKDGEWSENATSLHISISPPPWRSWWAYMLYGLVLTSFIFWLYLYNLRQVKMKHNLLMEKNLRNQEHKLHEERIRFFTNISHEIRTPLMLLINPLEDLITKESRYTRLGKTFTSMYRSANSLMQLINTLLEFRKTETGKLKLVATRCNLVEELEENCIAFRMMAERKGIELVFSSEEDKIEAWIDRDKLEMIMNNLLSNAIKNSYEKGRIDVIVKKDFSNGNLNDKGGSISIIVRDVGKGIPEDDIERIFERFYQVKDADNKGGTGIGLALTKRLVELHGGSIKVKSSVGRGTSFKVRLPLGNGHLTEDEMIHHTQESIPLQQDFAEHEMEGAIAPLLEKLDALSPDKKRILIVEDNEEIRIYLRNLLNEHFIIEEVEDGNSGLEKARKMLPSLVISDIMMPGLDGLELCKILKSEMETSHIPVMLITANMAHHIHINSLEVGADAYIPKPFKPDLLFSRIYNLIRSREKLHEYYIKKLKRGFLSESRSLSKDEEFLFRVNEMICENLKDPSFSISYLHQNLGMSRTVFYNKVKSLTNFSPVELIQQIRLKRAAELLSTTEYKVFEAMMEVGFNDEKHFRQIFIKQFGILPSEYKNYHKN